jgi:TolB-like protein/tetratricopeptide (TPR) repeat protein
MPSLFNELKRRNVVRVGVAYAIVAWLLIQLAGALEPALLLPDWVDRVVTVFLLIGFPVVLIFAWAFELTPEGLKLTRDVDPDESITPKTGKKLEHTTIALLALLVLFLVGREFFPTSQEGSQNTASMDGPASIAVLPFEDYSEDMDQDFFSKGISEEILNLLAKTNALRVAARTSSFAFGGSDVDIREIGNKLDVETVLEGSIRKSGPNIRVTAQLINVDDGYHLWSETYDRNYTDIFRIQDEIATEILTALKVHLLGEEVATHRAAETTVNMDAYSTYLIGKERLGLRTQEDIQAAHDLFAEALEIDPEFAPAHVQLAHADLLLERYEFGGDGNSDPEHDAEIREHLEIAMRLAPNLPEALGVNGYYQLRRNHYEEAEKLFNQALQLNPNYALAYLWRSETAYEQARYLDMLADKEKAYALDPMSLQVSADLAFDYRSFWRPKDAERVIDRMFALHPDHPLAYDAALQNMHAHGRLGEALLTVEQALDVHPNNKNLRDWRAWLLLQLEMYDDALAVDIPESNFYTYLNQGEFEQAKSILDAQLAEDSTTYWNSFGLDYLSAVGNAADDLMYNQYLDGFLAYLERDNVQWSDRCDTRLIYHLREAGRTDNTVGMMQKCNEVYEERLKVNYVCPCSFYGVVQYTILDGRLDDAVQRADQWLSNGDSSSWVAFDPVFMELQDRPEYPDLIARNAEQLERQRQIYLSGKVVAHP